MGEHCRGFIIHVRDIPLLFLLAVVHSLQYLGFMKEYTSHSCRCDTIF